MNRIEVAQPAVASLQRGHPWIFSGNILACRISRPDVPLAHIYAPDKRFLATGFYNPATSIACRVVSRQRLEELPASFWQARLRAALQRRERMGVRQPALRLVHGEADGLPGLIVDRYGDVLVLQSHILGIDACLTTIVEALAACFSPAAIYEKSMSPARAIEGLAPRQGLLVGRHVPEPHRISEHGLVHLFSIPHGQKTGLFLDQRDNRLRLRPMSRGGRVLNLFAYTGGFALNALAGGAEHVINVDASRPALDFARQAVLENGFDPRRVAYVTSDAFAFLAACKEQFELIVVDPPAFIKRRKDYKRGFSAYVRLNRMAMERLAPGGRLFTFSCSSLLSYDGFISALRLAAGQCGKTFFLISRHQAAADHPARLAFPEGVHLKACLLDAG